MKENTKWIITTFMLTFMLALLFGGVSNVVIEKLNIILAILVLVAVVVIGILFDMIGMAIATCDEATFHAKAAKKAGGAKEVLRLLKSKDRATNICSDLLGDICGIVSGSAGALISVKLAVILEIDVVMVSLVLSAIIAAVTVCGKALGKGISMKNAEAIMSVVGGIIHIIAPVKEKNKPNKKENKEKETK